MSMLALNRKKDKARDTREKKKQWWGQIPWRSQNRIDQGVSLEQNDGISSQGVERKEQSLGAAWTEMHQLGKNY